MLSSHHIAKLISEGEHQLLDFKFEVSDARKIARSFSAFANTDGGRLLIGVKDNGSIAGIRSDEEYFMLDAAANIYCDPAVPFHFKQWHIEGKNVLEVIIPKSEEKPHYVLEREEKRIAYIRSGDQNFATNRILRMVWKKEKHHHGVTIRFTEPEQRLLQILEKEPFITLGQFMRMTGINRHRAEQIMVRFVVMKLIKMVFTEHGVRYLLYDQTTD
jgi:predicted HTH transcriptional regulator